MAAFTWSVALTMSRPQLKLIDTSAAEKYPGVKTEYLSTNEYSLQNFISILNQAIATHPDGLAVPILNNQALQPILDKAISSGIPVVAFNISDPRPVGQRIKYLTYVGGDEYLTGLKLGEHVAELVNAGKIPKPTRVMVANHDATHQGLKARARGMTDAMKRLTSPSMNLSLALILHRPAASCSPIWAPIRM